MTSLRQRTILPLRGTSGALWFTLVARLCGLHSAAAAAAQKKKKKVVGFVHSMRPNI